MFNFTLHLGGDKSNRCCARNWSWNWKHDYQTAGESQEGISVTV